jgi:hypothetical protein
MVGELTLVLDEETRTAHELARLLREHAEVAIAPVLRIRRLVFVLVFLVVFHDEAFLQDDVEACLDVIVVDLVLILVGCAFVGFHDGVGDRNHDDCIGHDIDHVDVDEVVVFEVVVVIVVIEVIADVDDETAVVQQIVVAQILDVFLGVLSDFLSFIGAISAVCGVCHVAVYDAGLDVLWHSFLD